MRLKAYSLMAAALALGGDGLASAEPKNPKSFAQQIADKEIVFLDVNVAAAAADATMPNNHFIQSPMLVNAVKEVLDNLIRAHRELTGHTVAQIPFGIIQSDDFNCTVPPSGTAIICTSNVIQGVMASGGPEKGMDQLAFLLAHELAHVTIAKHHERYEKAEKLKKSWQTAGVAGALIAVAAISDYKSVGGQLKVTAPADAAIFFWNGALLGQDMATLMEQAASPAWSQENEDEADAYAILLMKQAHYDNTQAAPLLRLVEKQLTDRHQAGSVVGAMLKQGAQGAATRALLTKGDKLSTILGGGMGMLKGFTAATAHYHRAPGKRAESCAALASTTVDKKQADLDRQAMADPADTAAQIRLATYSPPATPPTPDPQPSAKPASKTTKGGKKSNVAKRGKVIAAPAPVKSYWQRFYEDSWQFTELGTNDQVRAKIATKDYKGAIALCPTSPRVIALRLSCAVAYIGNQQAPVARPMLEGVARSPETQADEIRLVGQLQSSLGDYPAALQTVAIAQGRFPSGTFYPDEIMVRTASGDITGAKTTGETCLQKAAPEIKDVCTKAIAALNKKSA